MYYLYSEDGRGDSGGMSIAFFEKEDGGIGQEHNARPRVGVWMRVGSLYARSYCAQDWWQTTKIVEIISDEEKEVVFKTCNSTYTWKIN